MFVGNLSKDVFAFPGKLQGQHRFLAIDKVSGTIPNVSASLLCCRSEALILAES